MWTEQFVLEALLSGSPRYEVMWATYWMSRTHPEQMRRAFGPVIGTRPRQNGQSFWFGVTAPG